MSGGKVVSGTTTMVPHYRRYYPYRPTILILHYHPVMISSLPTEERTNQMPYNFTLNKNITLRTEDFGGLVFNRKTGDTLDVDKELFALLELLQSLEQIEEQAEKNAAGDTSNEFQYKSQKEGQKKGLKENLNKSMNKNLNNGLNNGLNENLNNFFNETWYEGQDETWYEASHENQYEVQDEASYEGQDKGQGEGQNENFNNDLRGGLNLRKINMLLENSGFSVSQSELIEILKKLVKLQVVDYRFVNPENREARTGSSQIKNRKTSEADNLKTFEKPKGIKESREINTLNTSNTLSAPETVHWAVTYRCNSDCPDCYARRHKESFPEMNTREAKTMIDRLAGAGVFQLAIGGGEPLIRSDIGELVSWADSNGLIVHLTTGRENFTRKDAEELSPGLTSIQFGVQQDKLLSKEKEKTAERLQLSCLIAREAGIRPGANLVLTRTVLTNFRKIIRLLSEIGFKRIILLRYKPHDNKERWLKESVPPREFKEFESKIVNFLKSYKTGIADFQSSLRTELADPLSSYWTKLADPLSSYWKIQENVTFRFDCALSFLQRQLAPETARKAGIRGCVAADRIIAVGPDGSIYPCSQLVSQKTRAGNILENDLARLITSSKNLKKYRNFRDKKTFQESLCGICQATSQCGGCRVFSDDTLNEDAGCPGPVIKNLRNMNSKERRAELKHYIADHDYITVEQYMERYGVGQKKSARELKNISWLVKKNESDTGWKKSSCFLSRENWQSQEIEKIIGYNSSSVPRVPSEKIREIIKDDLEFYPDWLKKINQINS